MCDASLLRFARDLTKEYPRRTAEDVMQNCMHQELLNPLVTDLVPGAFDPTYQIKACSMHVVNLGCLQTHSGSVMDLLIKAGFFGSVDADVALHTATVRFKTWASANRMVHSVPMMTRNFLYNDPSGFPTLTLKAFNGRLFLSFLATCMRSLCNSMPQALEMVLAEQCTRALLKWFQLLEAGPRVFLEAGTGAALLEATDSYLRLTSGLARLALSSGNLRWKILPKHHVP